MRVLFFHSGREWSGAARVLSDAARGLAQRGVDVTFVCRPDSAVEERLSTTGYDFVPIDMEGSWRSVAWRLRRVILDKTADVVVAQSSAEHLVAAGAVRAAGRATVVRRVPAGTRLAPDGATKWAARFAPAGYLFTTSAEMQNAPAIRNRLRSAVADVGVDTAAYDEIRPATRPVPPAIAGGPTRLVVCVYDPDAPRGRVATALRTLAMLAPRHPELRLALLGRGSDAEDLRMHAAALKITGLVSHLGERDDHLQVLRAADVGWVTADQDAGAYGALDLMSLRIPVLADRGSIANRYVADGITGTLLPPGDTPASAAALAALLAHDDQRNTMGSAGRARVARDYSLTSMVDGFLQAIEGARERARAS
ncbi:MAG: glycosyltransferase family 4 protein [Gemmatimonadaceae bacterium]